MATKSPPKPSPLVPVATIRPPGTLKLYSTEPLLSQRTRLSAWLQRREKGPR